jgi:hypothetical protein
MLQDYFMVMLSLLTRNLQVVYIFGEGSWVISQSQGELYKRVGQTNFTKSLGVSEAVHCSR